MEMNAKNLVPLLGPIAVVCLATLVAYLGGSTAVSLVSFGMINLVLVLALYIFVGNTGIISFGHIGLVAIGAYVGAITSMSASSKALLLPDLPVYLAELTLPFWASILASGLVAGFVAFIFGIPLMRLHGFAAGVGTLAFLIIVRNVARNWKSVTGGAGTLNGIPIQSTLLALLGCVIFTMVIAFVYQSSRRGRLVRATREDRIAADALGVRTFRERIFAFTLSGVIAGCGGALYAGQLGSIAVDSFFLGMTFLVLAMLVIGGMTSLWGAVVGVVAVTMIQEGLRALAGLPLLASLPTGLPLVAVGAALLLVLLLRPSGLTGGHEFTIPRFRKR